MAKNKVFHNHNVPTVSELKELHWRLKAFHDWYFENDNHSSEGSDARTTIHVIESVIKYTPQQVEEDRVEDARRRFD